MDATVALQLSARILALLSLVQSLEFLALRRMYSPTGVWCWADIATELSGKGSWRGRFFGMFLSDRNFVYLNGFRIAVALMVLWVPSTIGLGVLLLLHLLTILRWLGTFNGGSDYMALLLLWSVALGLYNQDFAQICLWFVSLQVCLSYFKAGWYKLKVQSWRKGRALQDFLTSSTYERSKLATGLTTLPLVSRCLSWAIIGFELTFPLALMNSKFAAVYMGFGFLFHLSNAYFFGLNRFVLAWLAAYPAIAYCSL